MLLKNFFFSGVVLQFLLKARQKRQKKRRKTEEKTTTPNEQTVCCSNAINCTLERTNIKDLSMFIKLYIFCSFVSMQCDSCFFSQLFFPTRLLPLLCFVSLFFCYLLDGFERVVVVVFVHKMYKCLVFHLKICNTTYMNTVVDTSELQLIRMYTNSTCLRCCFFSVCCHFCYLLVALIPSFVFPFPLSISVSVSLHSVRCNLFLF